MTSRPGTQAMFEQLAADGIRWMFGNPGTVEQGFLDAVERVPEIGYMLALQETVAVAIADGYARAGQRPALVQLHSGVGLGNAIGMLYQARRGHSPLVVVAGEAGIRYDAMDAQMAADLVAMARPVTKYAADGRARRLDERGGGADHAAVAQRGAGRRRAHPRGPPAALGP
jgi:benzoylformate decarboxylase